MATQAPSSTPRTYANAHGPSGAGATSIPLPGKNDSRPLSASTITGNFKPLAHSISAPVTGVAAVTGRLAYNGTSKLYGKATGTATAKALLTGPATNIGMRSMVGGFMFGYDPLGGNELSPPTVVRMASTVITSSTATGSLYATRRMTSTVMGWSTASGVFGGKRVLFDSTVSARATVTGTVKRTARLTTTITGTSSVTADLLRKRYFACTVQGRSTMSGVMKIPVALRSTVTAGPSRMKAMLVITQGTVTRVVPEPRTGLKGGPRSLFLPLQGRIAV